MHGKLTIITCAVVVAAVMILACAVCTPAEAYRICTFKGTVVEHGWRTMTVKSGGQCAKINVGWRTKYIPNRRPCLGERVAVDFLLEDGYMKASKVVSLTPKRQRVTCYPPPPPSSSVCRTVTEKARDVCPPAKPNCRRSPPSHVKDKAWKPRKKKPKKRAKPRKQALKPEKKPTPTPEPTPDKTGVPAEKQYKKLAGDVVASSPKSLSIRVIEEGGAAEVMNVKVGLKTKFIPFRRPAVGEKVKVDYLQENGNKFGYTVQVVQ